MSYYDYTCPKCKHIVEDVYHSISDTIKVHCPDCLEVMTQLIGAAKIEFKGPRWAKDGYSSKNKSVTTETIETK
jgi:putative FmdB family regulatory protein